MEIKIGVISENDENQTSNFGDKPTITPEEPPFFDIMLFMGGNASWEHM